MVQLLRAPREVLAENVLQVRGEGRQYLLEKIWTFPRILQVIWDLQQKMNTNFKGMCTYYVRTNEKGLAY